MRTRLIAATLLIVLLAGCSRPAKDNQVQLRIVVVPMHQFDVYWKTVHAGVVKAANERKVKIVWQGPVKANDRANEIEIIQGMLGTKPDALVMGPVDYKALTGSVSDAHHLNIPVVVIDSPMAGHDFQAYVGTDNYAGGVSGGEYLAKLLNGHGDVAILRGVEGTASTDKREQGFLDAIAKYPGIHVVSKNIRGGENAETARTAAENILSPLRKADGTYAIDGVFASMESLTYGMMLALQQADLTGKVKFVGFDFSPQLVQGLDRGKVDALVTQDPVDLGYRSTLTAIDAAQGKPVEPVHYIPTVIVTKDGRNGTAPLHSPDTWKRVNPDLSAVN
jgi:ribose transport system substrate-binding protein